MVQNCIVLQCRVAQKGGWFLSLTRAMKRGQHHTAPERVHDKNEGPLCSTVHTVGSLLADANENK